MKMQERVKRVAEKNKKSDNQVENNFQAIDYQYFKDGKYFL